MFHDLGSSHLEIFLFFLRRKVEIQKRLSLWDGKYLELVPLLLRITPLLDSFPRVKIKYRITKTFLLPPFCWFFFRNVTEPYGLRNDTCFLSVMSQNFTDYATIPFFLLPECYGTSRIVQRCFLLIFGMSRNFTNCATMLSFDFRHVTELHELPNDGCQVPRSGQTKVACHQTMVLGRN